MAVMTTRGNITFRDRLERMWESSDFYPFFEKYSKRKPILIKKGNVIFYEGDQPDRLYFIKRGFVKIYRTSEEGKNTITYLYGPGSMLGIRALTSKDQCLKHTAEAITDVEFLALPRKDYLNAVAENPNFLVDLLNIFIDRLSHTERKLEGFITTDAIARVANFLSDTSSRFGEKKNDRITIPLSLTHQQIAECVGSVRETVTVALQNLEKNGVIEITQGKITIKNLKKLGYYTTVHKGHNPTL